MSQGFKQIHLRPLDEKPHPVRESNIFSSYFFVDGLIVNTEPRIWCKDVSISEMGLSPLSEKVLFSWGKKRGVAINGDLMLSAVLQISLDDTQKFRSKVWAKIKQEIENYLQSATSDFSSDGGLGSSSENMVEEASPDVLENPVGDLSEIDLYQHDADTVVIAADYIVLHDRIIQKQDQAEILDASIQRLNLSRRGENCLLRNKVLFIHQLIGMPIDTFYGFHSLGKKTAFEILEKLDLYLSKNVLLNDAESVVEDQGDANSKELLKNMLRISEIKNEILVLFRQSPFVRLSKDDLLLQIFDRKPNDEEIYLALDELVDGAVLFCEQGEYFCKYPSFFDILEKYAVTGRDSDKRSYEILNMRMEGKTLDAIGQDLHLTRERVRQIVSKLVRKVIKTYEGLFAEDQYAYLYETYWVPKEFLFILTKDDPRTAYYLEFRYEQGSLSLENALEDPRISIPMRREIEKWNYRNYIQIDGQMVPAEREALEQVVLRKFCQAACPVDEFFNRYNQFVSEQPLSEIQLSKVITTAEQRRSRENKLADGECLLWSHNRQLRYYNIKSLDFSDLFDALNLRQYKDVELSTSKFFRDYPDLMRQYDIRNEYELHNLLKKLSCEQENPLIHFSKMPTIRFGEFDRDQYVKNLLFELAPISAEDFAAYISEELGFSAMFVRNWFHCIDEYYYQGQFSVDYVAMSEENLALLKGHLDEDFYFFSEIKAIYAELVPNADLSEISTFNLKKLGFDVNGTYVYKNYPSAAVFFNHLYCKSDIVDCNAFYERFRQIVLFNQVRHELEKNYEIIEFEPMQYINIRRLEKLGIGKAQLKAFCDEVYNFVENNTFFTVEYIRNEGFTSSLDDLGFGSLFYASLLKCDPRFPNRNLGKNMMFHSGLRQVSIEAFILDYVKKVQSIDVEELIEVLYDDYSIILDRWKIIEQCNNTELYYDRIMGKIYANYDVYFEEI